MFIYQAFRFEDAPLWMLNGQNRLFTQEVLPSKCLINKRQHLTSSFEKPLCSQVLFKYLIRYTLFFFFLKPSGECILHWHAHTAAIKLNCLPLSDALRLAWTALRLVSMVGGWSPDATSKFSMTRFLSAREWQTNKQTNKKNPTSFMHSRGFSDWTCAKIWRKVHSSWCKTGNQVTEKKLHYSHHPP